MTAPTPEQMRLLADDLDADYCDSDTDCLERRSAAALRAAADQLEALRDVDRIAAAIYEVRDDTDIGTWDDLGSSDRERYECDARAAIAAITADLRTADTAPQEVDVTTDGIYGVTHFPLKEWTEPTDG